MDSSAQDDGLPGAQSPALPRLRWYQFRLSTLLAVMTAIIGLLVAWRTFVEPYRQQRQTMELIGDLGGTYESEAADRWQLWLFGADYQHVMRLNLADCDEPDRYVSQVAGLPKLTILAVGGFSFADDHLQALRRLPALRTLVLDSTSVSPEALSTWKSGRPDVDVYVSQRRAVAHLRYRTVSVEMETGANAGRVATIPFLDNRFFEEVTSVELNNRIAAAVRAGMGTRRIMREWMLKGGWFTADDIVYLGPLVTLEYLNLTEAPTNDEALAALRGLSQLEKLVLSRTQVGDAALVHSASLGNLQQLHLDGTQVTDAGLQHLGQLVGLKVLVLADTQVTDAGLVHLAGSADLLFLDLRGARVTAQGVQTLRARLPKCVIYGP